MSGPADCRQCGEDGSVPPFGTKWEPVPVLQNSALDLGYKPDRAFTVWVNRVVTDNDFGPNHDDGRPTTNEQQGYGNLLGSLCHRPGDPDDVMSFYPDNCFGKDWEFPGDGHACNPILSRLRNLYPQPHELEAAAMLLDALNADDNSGNDE